MEDTVDQAEPVDVALDAGTLMKDDPLKAAGIVALGYLGLRLAFGLLRGMWRHRWLTLVLFALVGVVYAKNKDELDRFIGLARERCRAMAESMGCQDTGQ
jgi:hypothetical protein